MAGIDDYPCLRWRIEQGNYDPLAELTSALREAAQHATALAAVSETDNPAAHDCYQLALQALEPVRAAIDRARKAREGE